MGEERIHWDAEKGGRETKSSILGVLSLKSLCNIQGGDVRKAARLHNLLLRR